MIQRVTDSLGVILHSMDLKIPAIDWSIIDYATQL